MVYEWKPGARVKGNAQKVGEELERIGNRDAEGVVKAARKSKGELHRCFEWDNGVAAEKYRLDQARLILRMVIVVDEPEEEGEEPIRYRAYEAVTIRAEDEEPHTMVYMPLIEALSDSDYREQIMGRLEKTIAQAETTAATYANLVPALAVTRDKLQEARESVRV